MDVLTETTCRPEETHDEFVQRLKALYRIAKAREQEALELVSHLFNTYRAAVQGKVARPETLAMIRNARLDAARRLALAKRDRDYVEHTLTLETAGC